MAVLCAAALLLPMLASAADGLGFGYAGGTATLAIADAQADPFNTEGQLRSGIAAYNKGNYAEAFRKFRNISTLGVPEAEYRLGLMYAEGLGVQRNPRLAAYWLNQAAKQNFPGASDALALIKPKAS
ncbi:MAG: hypothetical protein WC073_02085 [Sterolibacterium sp.]